LIVDYCFTDKRKIVPPVMFLSKTLTVQVDMYATVKHLTHISGKLLKQAVNTPGLPIAWRAGTGVTYSRRASYNPNMLCWQATRAP